MAEHDGHRARMRERFRENGLDGFAPHEVLELLLFYSRTRGDTNLLAHQLLDTFGSLKGVLEASTDQLMTINGVGEETATLISLIIPLFRRYAECVTEERNKIRNLAEASEYCLSLLSGERAEHFYSISLSENGSLLGRRLIAEGTASEVQAYPRKVVEAALNHNAAGVLLCHNHPNGDCTPSDADIEATRTLQSLLTGLQMTLLDHIIVSGSEVYSMAKHGLI